MSIEQAPRSEQPDSNEKDDIADFLADVGIDWDAIQSLDYTNLPESEENKLSPTRTSYGESPILARDKTLEVLKTARIPDIFQLDHISEAEIEQLATPIEDAYSVSHARRLIRTIVKKNMGEDGLNVDEGVLDKITLAASEILTNAYVYGMGSNRIFLGRTSYNNFFLGVENKILEDQRTEALCQTVGDIALRRGLPEEDMAADDLHNRGLHLIAACSVNGVQVNGCCGIKEGRTVSAGYNDLPLDALEKLAHFSRITDDDLRQTRNGTRKLVWGVFGNDTDAMRQADLDMAS